MICYSQRVDKSKIEAEAGGLLQSERGQEQLEIKLGDSSVTSNNVYQALQVLVVVLNVCVTLRCEYCYFSHFTFSETKLPLSRVIAGDTCGPHTASKSTPGMSTRV